MTIQEIEAIKARVKEMEEEAEKLKELQREVEKESSMSTKTSKTHGYVDMYFMRKCFFCSQLLNIPHLKKRQKWTRDLFMLVTYVV